MKYIEELAYEIGLAEGHRDGFKASGDDEMVTLMQFKVNALEDALQMYLDSENLEKELVSPKVFSKGE